MAVNKIDAVSREGLAHEFHSLGFSDLFSVSAEHRLGLEDLLDHLTADFAKADPGAEPKFDKTIKVAIIGRPNVGKSTLLNALLGEERSIVSPVAGTTRDAVDAEQIIDGVKYVFVDTAGIRRKGKTRLMAEKLSVVMARRNIRMANVVLLVMDATEGVIAADATIAGYAHEEGRALILCVNKWDAATNKNQREFEDQIRYELKFAEYAPVLFISAKTGAGVKQLLPRIREVFDSASQRVTTGELNRFVETLKDEHEPRILYVTQPSVRPPTFVLFTDRAGELHFSKQRFLINQIRERFGFMGTPIVIKIKPKVRRKRT
jgi:GTP-binding protein